MNEQISREQQIESLHDAMNRPLPANFAESVRDRMENLV